MYYRGFESPAIALAHLYIITVNVYTQSEARKSI